MVTMVEATLAKRPVVCRTGRGGHWAVVSNRGNADDPHAL